MKTWTDDMGEISGFGGGYEALCRAMALAGINWLDEHPNASPSYKGFKGVFGLITEDNDDAKELEKAIMGVDGATDCAGAMHHAAVNHCLAYKRLGWDEYCNQLRSNKKVQR